MTTHSKELAAFGGCVAVAIGVVALVFVSAVVEGFVLARLWNWHAVPLGFPAITLAWAIGLAAVVGAVKTGAQPNSYKCKLDKPSRQDAIGELVGTLVMRPGTLLLIGWVAHHFT